VVEAGEAAVRFGGLDALECGEDVAPALVREVRQELDLVCRGIEPRPVWSGIFDAPVKRPDRARVRVSFYRVTEAVGTVIPREGQGWGLFSEAEMRGIEGFLSPANTRALGAILVSAFGLRVEERA